MLAALDECPVNVLLLGKGNTVSAEALREQLRGGAGGFKLHEDWGSTPAAIDACLRVADETGVQVAIHTDTLNEAGFLESTVEAIAGRTIHAYHTEGAGGGHAPDIIRIASYPNVLPSSTNPTRPHTVNTVAEHLDMLMVCHHLNPRVPEDLAFAESRIRATTIAAEDVLHDLGAISMIGSDSQAMGRAGETIIRTWQTAHVMKARSAGPRAAGPTTTRARRYVAKYTICPAVAHGIDAEVGSVEAGKLADLVLWDPRFFGVRPHVVLKGGAIAWAPIGDANASIPTPQPVLGRPMFAGRGRAAAEASLAFVSPAALEDGLAERLGSAAVLVPVAEHPAARQGRHAREQRPARDPRRARHASASGSTASGSSRAPRRAPARAALLPLLMMAVLPLLLLTDARFPAGGYAHSGGLEAAVEDGLTRPASVPSFLTGRLRGVAGPERMLAVAAARAARARRPRRAARARRRGARPLPEPAAPRRPPRGSARSCCARQPHVWPERARAIAAYRARERRRRPGRSRSASSPRRPGSTTPTSPAPASTRTPRACSRPRLYARSRSIGAARRRAGSSSSRRSDRPARGRQPSRRIRATRASSRRRSRRARAPLARPRRHARGGSLPPERALRIGVGGPVGSGKSSLVAALCRALGGELAIGVVTNDIYTTEDALFLRRTGVLPPERILAVETGCCPHTAIRDDISANLEAVAELERERQASTSSSSRAAATT